ncbi:BREX-1 system adenine-specific DNA-methyltransferase PglX [Flavobacteriales bacterium]|nr:BREX-1 system adenine-specific DNA-methyltransferase PglX [Flavobacteriales bacterium]
MNTNALKKFAQEARKKLISQVGAKLEYVLTSDSAELREKAAQVKKLQEAINETSKEQVIDKVAYTWFNRLMALRFMDANDYQPIGLRVLTPKEGYTLPELLDEAKQGHIPEELPVKHQRIYDLLDGKIPSSNAQNEAFKLLLVGACNHLNTVFPFLFEKINDYAELLLPDDLTSEFSIVQDICDGMSIEDCGEVEIVGWLYQFYISELNDELISSKKKYDKNELAPASQLFTPKWIVEYMVDNTLGQLWTEISPSTKITDSLDYYIKPAYEDKLEPREKKSVEDIKFFEPCVGSGHILSYAFDVFYKIYEEEGYNPSEIPELIITKNLYGTDIDQRAAQLASFVLCMKGRQKQRRFLRAVEKNQIQPNVSYYQDFEFDNKFNNAAALGSLIRVEQRDIDSLEIDENSLFGERQKEVQKLYGLLGQRYDVVVTNPPYISSSRMEGTLKQFVETIYPETKSDLFATFILRCLELCNEDGLTGYMTPFVWMFISSYEKLREIIIDKHFINNLIQLEYSGFDGATVPICTFTLRQKFIKGGNGSYVRLSDFKGAQNQAPKTLEAIQNQDCGWFFKAQQKDFEKIPGSPIGYWASKNLLMTLDNPLLGEFLKTSQGMKTLNNDRFIRFWNEVEINQSSKVLNKDSNDPIWFPINHGGEYLKWFGNNESVLNWYDDGVEIKTLAKKKYNSVTRTVTGMGNYFKEGITWTAISSASFSARAFSEGFLFTNAGMCAFGAKDDYLFVLGLLNSKIGFSFLEILSPTLNFGPNQVKRIPVIESKIDLVKKNVDANIQISKLNWDSREISWDFSQNELIRLTGQDVEESFDLYMEYWKKKFFHLHGNEEELNRQLIEIYGLEEELIPDIALKNITILKEETSIENGELMFHAKEVFAQFISYAVGCMFGRYSLAKEGLILANHGETLEDYLKKVEKSEAEVQFLPDDDNIIPILDDEWFEDDIVGRFYEFLKVTFGEANFEKNLAFVEECIGKDIRKFFVKDFYNDHIKRYKKRPIYWMFSSPKGSFNVLIYMHRYTPDTLNQILNGYLKEYQEKLKTRMEHLDHLIESGTSTEQTKAAKEKDKLKVVLLELQEYEREILYPLATDRIPIDLDDGVLVNYNKFGNAIKEVSGLNDKKAKDKVRKFDWIDTEEIR